MTAEQAKTFLLSEFKLRPGGCSVKHEQMNLERLNKAKAIIALIESQQRRITEVEAGAGAMLESEMACFHHQTECKPEACQVCTRPCVLYRQWGVRLHKLSTTAGASLLAELQQLRKLRSCENCDNMNHDANRCFVGKCDNLENWQGREATSGE
jgi:hypothetical protein